MSVENHLLKELRNESYSHQRKNHGLMIFLIVSLAYLMLLKTDSIVRNINAGNSMQLVESTAIPGSSSPHIVFVHFDDMGWNDVGYQSTDLYECTPFIDDLAAGGVKLTNYYAQQSCTPTRAALLTGKYAMHIGMQHDVIWADQPWGLPTNEILLPQYLKEVAAYATHIVGKWHLGHFTNAHLPRSRGFDTFYGFYSGYIDYFNHRAETHSCIDSTCFLDWQDGKNHLNSESDVGKYSPEIYSTFELSSVACNIILQHKNAEHPLFMYYSPPNVHEPLMAPDELFVTHKRVLDTIPNKQRRTFAAMLISLDKSMENLTQALKTAGIYETAFLVVASDNGANTLVQGSGSNYPLRGQKGYLFEGGLRVPAFVHSPLIPYARRGVTYEQLFHVADWLPTFLDGMLHRGDLLGGHSLNGINQWNSLLYGNGSVRNEFVYNIDPLGDHGKPLGFDIAAIRVGKWKLITNELNVTRYPVPGANEVMQNRIPNNGASGDTRYHFLFDLVADPEERVNLYDSHPGIVKNLTITLGLYRNRMVDSEYCPWSDEDAKKIWTNGGSLIGPWRQDDDVECRT